MKERYSANHSGGWAQGETYFTFGCDEVIAILDQFLHQFRIFGVALHQPVVLVVVIRLGYSAVLAVIVQTNNFVALVQKLLHQVAAYESGRTRDEGFHRLVSAPQKRSTASPCTCDMAAMPNVLRTFGDSIEILSGNRSAWNCREQNAIDCTTGSES